ncbi:MAG: hypothetical protein M1823_005389 [Watsoniomyces obsoletus]|nr:MAG: hypothetical protein M1823_005389 [Watsoniomyces obsoletus]
MARIRTRQLILGLATLICLTMTILSLRTPPSPMHPAVRHRSAQYPLSQQRLSASPGPPEKLHLNASTHPIHQLMTQAEQEFEEIRGRQSSSLEEAVQEYRRRYGINPPPRFDRWYKFATSRGVEMIDEYDTIHHALLPFWALDPATIRARATESLGYENTLMGLAIRKGRCTLVQGGTQWQQSATVGMVKSFVSDLPDMDLAFNIHDEPRVMVPHDDLIRLVHRAIGVRRSIQDAAERPINKFSRRPADVGDGMTFPEAPRTRFNRYPHQPVWIPSRLSCPPDSPSRSLDEHPQDDPTSYSLGELGFVSNITAFSDICQTPSLRESYGFFDRPNAFDVVHDLFPVFSQSKVSSFQDILFPSPWYWFGKVPYDEHLDPIWTNKTEHLYWRGSTTGGFSRNGGWRRQHRQRTVRRMNAPDHAKIMERRGTGADAEWSVKEVLRSSFKSLFDVKFSHVGQCDAPDCDAQREFFEVVKPAGQQDAWQSKYLLDMDGNAFSGRFYAFLKSRSLVYKEAIFREWHQDWLRPWVHYVPLSLRGAEYLESVRYFAQEEEGQVQAERLAMEGREWANRVLRNEDFEVWLFRLLLEYGRLVDDQRESIGYGGIGKPGP